MAATDFHVPAYRRYSSCSEHVVSVGFGRPGGALFGRGIFLAIYLIAGFTGSILGIAWHPFTVVAGASGAIFGIAGALLAGSYFSELAFPRHAVKALLLSLVAFTTYNLLLGILSPPADNAAHFGGLLIGFLLGLLLLRFPVCGALFAAQLSDPTPHECLHGLCGARSFGLGLGKLTPKAANVQYELGSGHSSATSHKQGSSGIQRPGCAIAGKCKLRSESVLPARRLAIMPCRSRPFGARRRSAQTKCRPTSILVPSLCRSAN